MRAHSLLFPIDLHGSPSTAHAAGREEDIPGDPDRTDRCFLNRTPRSDEKHKNHDELSADQEEHAETAAEGESARFFDFGNQNFVLHAGPLVFD